MVIPRHYGVIDYSFLRLYAVGWAHSAQQLVELCVWDEYLFYALSAHIVILIKFISC